MPLFNNITDIATAMLILFPLMTVGAFLSFLFIRRLSTAGNMIAILGMLNIVWLGFLRGDSQGMDITEGMLILAVGVASFIASALIVRIIFFAFCMLITRRSFVAYYRLMRRRWA
jgi:hypothetical protein